MDLENADFNKVLAALKEKFGNAVCPAVIPVGDVYVDLITRKAFTFDAKGKSTKVETPDDPMIEELEDAINEAIAEADDELMEKFFGGEDISIDDLAELKGKRFQPKRNHINRFLSDHPDVTVLPLSDETLPDAKALADRWHQRRSEEEDAGMELVALNRAFAHWKELGMEGLVLYVGNQVVAMTMGSRLSDDTFDVHFEKADLDYAGAYAVINRAFARHIRDKYPEVKFLNREEDMGIEGLRKAKLSYHPHHMVEKCWAHLMTEEFHDY